MSEDQTQIRESLRRKRAARIAAVQAVYTYMMRDKPPKLSILLDHVTQQWRDSIAAKDEEWPMMDMPENAMFVNVTSGTIEHMAVIDAHIQSRIKENWKPERMDPVMRALLRCAVYELDFEMDRKTHVILDEYVTIAGGFFDGQELGYIHSALQQLAPVLRGDQASETTAADA